jgi:tetratricopeptide (TPR) repeat protein
MSRRRLLPWLLAGVAAATALAPQTGLAWQSSRAGVSALVRQAAFWRERGRKDLAGQSLQRALAADPGNVEALAAMARYAREDGDIAGAERWTARLRQAAPNDPRLRQLSAPVAAVQPRAEPARPAASPPAPSQPPPPARPAAPVDRAGPLRASGFAALEKGQLDAAARDFEAALKIRPSDQDALGGLGVVRLRQERFDEAEPLLAKASAGSPQSRARWREALASARFYGGLRAAQAALAAGDASKAERLVAPLANGSGRDVALAQQLLGDALARQGRLAEAEAAYRQAAGNAPGSPDIQTGLVEALVAQGKIAEAEALAAKTPGGATASVSTRARIAQAKADEAWAVGDLAGARAAFETALAAFPSEPWLRLDYARFLLERGETSSADGLMSPLASSVGAEPLHAAALWADQRNRPRDGLVALDRIPPGSRTAPMEALAQSLRDRAVIQQARQAAAAGRGYEAASSLRALLARPGLPMGTAGEAASALYDLGDAEPALAAAQQALMVDVPAAPAAYDGFVSVLAKAGRDAEAAALIRQASTKAAPTPENRRAVAGLAATLAAERADRLRLSGDLASAFDTLSQASVVAPDSPRILAALGRLYLTGHMPDEASRTYEALLRLKPGDPEALAGTAEAALALNDLPRARDNLRLAMARSPDDAGLYLLRARIETAAGDRRAALEALQAAKALGVPRGRRTWPGRSRRPGAQSLPRRIEPVAGRSPRRAGGLAVADADAGERPGDGFVLGAPDARRRPRRAAAAESVRAAVRLSVVRRGQAQARSSRDAAPGDPGRRHRPPDRRAQPRGRAADRRVHHLPPTLGRGGVEPVGRGRGRRRLLDLGAGTRSTVVRNRADRHRRRHGLAGRPPALRRQPDPHRRRDPRPGRTRAARRVADHRRGGRPRSRSADRRGRRPGGALRDRRPDRGHRHDAAGFLECRGRRRPDLDAGDRRKRPRQAEDRAPPGHRQRHQLRRQRRSGHGQGMGAGDAVHRRRRPVLRQPDDRPVRRPVGQPV